MPCWQMKFVFLFSFLVEAGRFCTNTDWYMELFIIPCTTSSKSSWRKTTPKHDDATTMPCCEHGDLFNSIHFNSTLFKEELNSDVIWKHFAWRDSLGRRIEPNRSHPWASWEWWWWKKTAIMDRNSRQEENLLKAWAEPWGWSSASTFRLCAMLWGCWCVCMWCK